MARSYLSIYLWGLLFVFLYFYICAVLRSFGDGMMQMVAILFCTVVNLLLDPFFISRWGVAGAALATVLSQGTGAVMLGLYCFRKGFLKFSTNFDGTFVRPLLAKQAPSIVQQCLPAVSTSFITSLVSGFPIAAIAGFGIAGKLEMIPLFFAMALQMTVSTAMAQCVGGNQHARGRRYVTSAVKAGCLAATVLTVAILAFSPWLSRLFIQLDEVEQVVRTYFLIIGTGYVFNTGTNCLLGGINGLGRPGLGMGLMVFYYLVVRMPLAWLLSRAGLGLSGVWTAVLISHAAAFASASVCYMVLTHSTHAEISPSQVVR